MTDPYEFGDAPSVCVDVDGTLLLWPGGNPGRVPRPGEPGHGEPPTVNVALVQALVTWHRAGRSLIVWTWGDIAHAQRAADLCGLKPNACVTKPYVIVDDAEAEVMLGKRRARLVRPHR